MIWKDIEKLIREGNTRILFVCGPNNKLITCEIIDYEHDEMLPVIKAKIIGYEKEVNQEVSNDS